MYKIIDLRMDTEKSTPEIECLKLKIGEMSLELLRVSEEWKNLRTDPKTRVHNDIFPRREKLEKAVNNAFIELRCLEDGKMLPHEAINARSRLDLKRATINEQIKDLENQINYNPLQSHE